MAEQVQEQKAAEEQKPNDKEYNFRQLEKARDAAEQARRVAEAKLAKYESDVQEAAKKKYLQREPDDDDDHSDEPYVDERRLNRKFAKFEERFDKKVDEKAEQKARAMLEQERNANFLKQNPDFNQVLSPEVIEKFATKHPEIAEPMLEMPEGFSRQKLLYQNIKALGLHKPQEKAPSIQDTINKNQRGPFYQPTGISPAPYAGGGDFSEVGQKSAYQKVQELKSRLRL